MTVFFASEDDVTQRRSWLILGSMGSLESLGDPDARESLCGEPGYEV